MKDKQQINNKIDMITDMLDCLKNDKPIEYRNIVNGREKKVSITDPKKKIKKIDFFFLFLKSEILDD
ncbi:hypothetical protein DY124_05340 [Apilactobacillus micheneri]|nr:hypothetical protein DY124_05340 [Apilactobacillus micheneri]TPR47531.1 hypothetical protein DY125_05340 [Apilactobacillus micheneri]